MKSPNLQLGRSFSLVLCGLALGCTSGGGAGPAAAGAGGSVNARGGSGPGEVPVGTNPGGVTITCDQGAAPGVSPLMKLSTLEYRNTVKDLLTSVGAAAVLPALDGLLASIPDDSLGEIGRAS